jgi:hypothetical protein
MNSPIYHGKDLDPVLRYAPPRVRQQGEPTPDELAPPLDRPRQRDDGNDPDFCGDRAIVAMQRRLALEPEWIPEPPPSSVGDGRDLWKIILRAGAVLVFAAVTAWIAVSIPGAKRFGTEVVRASFPQASSGTSLKGSPQSSAAPVTPADQAEGDQPKPPVGIVATAAQEPTSRRDSAEQASSTAPAAASVSQPAPVPAPVMTTREPSPAPTVNFVTRQLEPAELASMLQRADDFIKSGDLSSARLLLRRAAEAGDANAALVLAGTFDPNVLKTLGFQEAAADIAKARLWYDRAEKVGSAEAQQRLQLLATAIHSER